MRYLTRNKIYEKVEAKIEAKKIYIFCEGEETEIKYFKYFQGLSSNIDIIPIPNNNGQSDPVKLKNNAIILFFGDEHEGILPQYELSKEYKDEVWFVIDTDRWNEGNKIELLKIFCNSQDKTHNLWNVVQSNPCFELWFYYHFNDNKPDENIVKNFNSFKEFINNQIKGGFDCRSMPIELKLAIDNSIKNFEIANDQPNLFSTEVHSLGEVIISFVGSQLDKAREMMQNPDRAEMFSVPAK